MRKKVYSQVLPFQPNKTVLSQFGFLPVSVLNPTTKSKDKWTTAYIDQHSSERRRSGGIQYLENLGFSEFHAGLAENIIRYWSLKGSVVVDPFAGRATRAVVSATLGREYYGYEISPFTFKRVTDHINSLSLDTSPTIYNDDGCVMKETADDVADLVFTCPPYWNLEEYEDVPGQLSSAKSYADFMKFIITCGENIYRVLKPGAFCVWVCADFRGWEGNTGLYPFHVDTINAFSKTGLTLYDVVILQNKSPFAALQMGKVASKRYTSKIHEYILVFRKPGEYVVPDYCDTTEEDVADKFFDFTVSEE